ncbi:MAG: hypothetical protein AAFZ07_26100 [Actinomycetota bacterium]
MSLVVLRGVVRDAGTLIELADGRTLRTVDLLTDDGPINLVWEAAEAPGDVDDGEDVVAVGGLRRRFFRTGGRTVGVTEVVLRRSVRARRRAVVERALEAVFAEEAAAVRS